MQHCWHRSNEEKGRAPERGWPWQAQQWTFNSPILGTLFDDRGNQVVLSNLFRFLIHVRPEVPLRTETTRSKWAKRCKTMQHVGTPKEWTNCQPCRIWLLPFTSWSTRPGFFKFLKSGDEILKTKVAPDYEAAELGVGDSIIIKALCENFGRLACWAYCFQYLSVSFSIFQHLSVYIFQFDTCHVHLASSC